MEVLHCRWAFFSWLGSTNSLSFTWSDAGLDHGVCHHCETVTKPHQSLWNDTKSGSVWYPRTPPYSGSAINSTQTLMVHWCWMHTIPVKHPGWIYHCWNMEMQTNPSSCQGQLNRGPQCVVFSKRWINPIGFTAYGSWRKSLLKHWMSSQPQGFDPLSGRTQRSSLPMASPLPGPCSNHSAFKLKVKSIETLIRLPDSRPTNGDL